MYEWTPGLKFDPKWHISKKRWYGQAFKKNDPEGWKKDRLARIKEEEKKLSE